MILTKNSLKIFKILVHDAKIQILNAIKVSNTGIYAQNRDLVLKISHVGKKFRKNSICGAVSLLSRSLYFSTDSVKKILASIKPDKKSKIYGDFANAKNFENLSISKGVANSEEHFNRHEEHFKSSNPEFFEVNKKRFFSGIEFLNVMSGKQEDLDNFRVAVTDNVLYFETENSITGEKTKIFFTKVKYNKNIKLRSVAD